MDNSVFQRFVGRRFTMDNNEGKIVKVRDAWYQGIVEGATDEPKFVYEIFTVGSEGFYRMLQKAWDDTDFHGRVDLTFVQEDTIFFETELTIIFRYYDKEDTQILWDLLEEVRIIQRKGND